MTRSAPGTGSIQDLGEGRWKLRVSQPPDPWTGKRRQLARTVRGNKTQARKALNALLAERGGGRIDGSAITVVGLVSEWLDNDTDLSPTTLDGYKRVRRLWLQGPFGAKPAAKVTVAEVRALYQELRRAKVSPWSIQTLHKVLSRAYNFGMELEWLARNPVALVSPPSAEPKVRPVPLDTDVIALLNEAGHDFAVFLRLLAAAGARRGEICGLQWGDVDLDRQEATIRRAVVYTSATGVVVKSTKTRKVRVVTFDETTGRMLAAHRLNCVTRARMVDAKLDDDTFLFSNELDGSTPRRPDWATQRFIRLRNKLGIDIQMRQLRNDSVTFLLDAGIAPNSVSTRHGHARTSMTLDVYAKPVAIRDKEMAELVGRRLDGR